MSATAVNQATLWDVVPHPRARARDTQTALDAARSLTPGRTERLILEVAQVPFTDDELAARLPQCYPPTVKSARSRLTAQGLLVDTGITRPSVRGRAQIVWRMT